MLDGASKSGEADGICEKFILGLCDSRRRCEKLLSFEIFFFKAFLSFSASSRMKLKAN